MTRKNSRAEAGATKHVPLRSCLVCRNERPKRELLRVVSTTDGMVEVDESGKRPGRGAYLCRSAACWGKGLTKGRLEKALRRKLEPESRDRLVRFGAERSGQAGESE